MKSTLEWITKRGGLTPDQQKAIGAMYQQNESLINLISDLLVFVKIGNTQFKDEKIDLAGEIDAIIGDVKRKNSRVSFSFEKKSPVFVFANRSLVIQVFSNLISNAAEYSDKTAGRVHAVLKSEGLRHVFSVENNGLSISAEDQPKIFSKFFRASNASLIKKSGTGLGLFIVKMICDGLGWRVGFQSPIHGQDYGTIFFVTIPGGTSPFRAIRNSKVELISKP